MKDLTRFAKYYVLFIIVVGFSSAVLELRTFTIEAPLILIVAGVIAAFFQTLKIEGSTVRSSFSISWIVFGFTFALLGPPAAIIVILFAHIIEWIRHRYLWYIQLFNMGSFAIVVTLAGLPFGKTVLKGAFIGWEQALLVLIGLAIFTLLNHLFIGLVIKLARGQNLNESGVFGTFTLILDFTLLCLGAAAAIIWTVNPYGVVLVGFITYLLYESLKVPALERQTKTDPKTGLYNADYYKNAVENELNRAKQFDRPLTLVMADLDLLRVINNTYGHVAGDVVLVGIADLLKEGCRDFDIVSRFGGEEFAILMPETSPDRAYHLIEEIRSTIAENAFTISTNVSPIKVTMSFGIACRADADESVDALIHCADVALYQAKQNGRNQTRIYSPDKPGIKSVVTMGLVPPEPRPSDEDPERKISPITKPDEENGERVSKRTVMAPEGPGNQPEVAQASSSARWIINGYIIGTGLAAVVLALILTQSAAQLDWTGLIFFVLTAFLTETMAVEIYVQETAVSTSAAPLLAGSLLFGPISGIVLGVAAAVATYFKNRSTFDRFAFNTSNLIIGNLLAVGLVGFLKAPLAGWPVPIQLVITILAMGLVYLSTTALVAGAVSLSGGQPLLEIWRERFRWLAPYYLALGIVSYALIFSYNVAGIMGTLVILVPLFMLRFSQKQYIDHTKILVNQLRENNSELVEQASEITLLNEELLLTLARSIDLRDPYVMEHSKNVSRYAVLTAEELGLSPERVDYVRKAGLLHDIGKLGIPERILFKPAQLSAQEFKAIKEHVGIGAELIYGCHSLHNIIPFVKHHHEFFNGDGYPDGLKGEEIPLEARILGLADAVEAMASDRPYKRARSAQAILQEINDCAGGQFDPKVTAAFIRVVEKQGASIITNSARLVRSRQHEEEGNENHNKADGRPSGYPAAGTGD